MNFKTCFRTLVAVVAITTQVKAAAFTAGDLIVLRAGTGTGALAAGATAAFLDEYSVAGVLQQSIALPTAASGSQLALTLVGNSTTEGLLAVSGNGQYLTLGGYNAVPSATDPRGVAGNRVAGRIDLNGNIDTSTLLSDLSGATNNIRSVVSNDGTQFWAGTAANGVHYTTLGNTGASTQISATTTGALANVRDVKIQNNQLYTSSMSGAFRGVNTVGSGLPTTSGQAIALLPGFDPSTSSPESAYDYWFKDANTLFVADDRATSSGGGIQKWTQTAGSWSLAYTMSTGTAGVRGLSVGGLDVSGDTVLFANTTSNNLVMVWDTNGANAPIQTVTTAATNTALRGLAYLPGLPLPGPPAPPPPPPAPRLPQNNDVVFGLSSSSNAFGLELVSGPASANGGVAAGTPWTTDGSFVESVKFDNKGGLKHNAHGNLLGVNFNAGAVAASPNGQIYSFGTQTTIPAPARQLIGNTGSVNPVGQDGSLPAATLGGLSVSPNNDKIAVTTGGTAANPGPGALYVYDYTPGDTHGASAALAHGRSTGTIMPQVNSQGSAWLDNNTVMAFAANGGIFTIDATTMGTTGAFGIPGGVPAASGVFTSLAYNPDLSPYVYAMYSGFSTPNSTARLYILDPANSFALKQGINLDTQLNNPGTTLGDTPRDLAMDSAGNLYISGFGSAIDILPNVAAQALTDTIISPSSLFRWYQSSTFSSFPGLDFGFASGVTGDYNADGKVNAQDYVIWRKTNINGAQGYTDWRANYGTGGAGSGAGLGGASVPEPTSVVLFAIGLVAFCARRRSA